MRQIKVIVVTLILGLFFSIFAVKVEASETDSTIGFDVELSSANVKVGEQVQVTVSLIGYTGETDPIKGIQVDISGVDTNVLSVVEAKSLIVDTTAVSNTASYNDQKKIVRLAYVQMQEGNYLAPCEDVFSVIFQVNSGLTENSSITLPIKVIIITESKSMVLKSECTINYSVEGASVTSVDISWGDMAFEYSDGIWNPQTHCYDDAGWSDNGSGYIEVSNKGNSEVKAEFKYDTARSDITGSFSDGSEVISDVVNLETGQEKTVYLKLSGKPTGSLNSTIIGTVIIKIGGE